MTKMDPNKMMAQLGKMQEQMAQAQEELKTAYVEHSAGGGAVTVKASGALEITEITIKPEAIDPDDPEMLQDLLVSAVNGAITAAQALQHSGMNHVVQDVELGLDRVPGLCEPSVIELEGCAPRLRTLRLAQVSPELDEPTHQVELGEQDIDRQHHLEPSHHLVDTRADFRS